VILPERIAQPGLDVNGRGMSGAPVGIVRPPNWGNAKFNDGALASGEIAESDLINIAGFNSFYFEGAVSLGTYSVQVCTPDYTDLATPFASLFLNAVGTVNPAITQLVFGAPNGPRPADVWGYIRVRIIGGNPVGCADAFLTMLLGTR
jgi:hypothetical protein